MLHKGLMQLFYDYTYEYLESNLGEYLFSKTTVVGSTQKPKIPLITDFTDIFLSYLQTKWALVSSYGTDLKFNLKLVIYITICIYMILVMVIYLRDVKTVCQDL